MQTKTTPDLVQDDIIEKAWAARNPGIFTDFYLQNSESGFAVYPGSTRHT